MRGIRGSALILTTLVAALSAAQDVPVEKYKLPNGMTVILHEDHTLPVATINIWYRVGSKDEMPRRSGFAHLFEHLMFMGTKRAENGKFDTIMEGGGGSNNASTAEDRTNYYSVGPAGLLPTLLWLDADRLQALGDNMTTQKVDLQRDVVKNERRQNTENTPYGKAYESISAIMYPQGHPYAHSVIGSMQDLSDATLQDVKDFFATYYVPNNASLVVAGDFNPKEIKPLIANWFGTLPRKDDPPRPFVPPVNFHGVVRRTMTDQVQASKILMVWHSPASFQPGDAEMDLTGAVLTDGLGSKLYDRLVVKDKLASEVSAFQDSKKLGSLFYIDTTLTPGADAAKVEAAIDEELIAFCKQGPKPADLKRIVAQLEYRNLAQLQSIEQKADKLNAYEFAYGDPNSFARDLDRYRKATPTAVRETAKKVLDLDSRLILTVVPQSEEPTGPDPRDAQPAIAPAGVFNPPAPQIFKLSNGLKVEYFHRPELPLMALTLQLRGGAGNDPTGKFGRGQMTAAMLDEGAGNKTAQQFQDALDDIGATFGASASEQATNVNFSVLSSKFGPGLSLFADAIQRPRFDKDAFDRVQRVSVANLEQANDDPGQLATREALRAYFGANHPYGSPVQGTIETVKALGISDLKAQHDEVFRPENGTLFVAGSLDEASVKVELEKAFSGWKGTGKAATQPSYPQPEPRKLQAIVIDRPGAVQTVIRFMMPAPPYSGENRVRYGSIGTLLGGSFTSRLNQNLREAKGYTYGAGSRFIFAPQFGYLVASSSVRADVTGASLKEFFNEFDRMSGGDITDEEAAKAISIQRTETIQAMGTLSGLLGVAADYDFVGRPFGDISQDLSLLSKLTVSDLNGLAKTAIPVQKGVLVLVGDKATILKQLEGFKPDLKIVVKEAGK